jgi:gluconokinase
MVVLMMGVSGSGKNYVGEALARKIKALFIDADDYHSVACKFRMKSRPLTERHRAAWIQRLALKLASESLNHCRLVIACSALRSSHRKQLANAVLNMQIVWLRINYSKCKTRLHRRKNHFFGPELLRHQFSRLQRPENALTINSLWSRRRILGSILTSLNVTVPNNPK